MFCPSCLPVLIRDDDFITSVLYRASSSLRPKSPDSFFVMPTQFSYLLIWLHFQLFLPAYLSIYARLSTLVLCLTDLPIISLCIYPLELLCCFTFLHKTNHFFTVLSSFNLIPSVFCIFRVIVHTLLYLKAV